MMIVIVRTLEYVCSYFLSAAIAKVSEYMKLTEALAGATLLAFSNGATDVITAMVASGSGGSTELMVGGLFGASTFAITIILSAIIWSTKSGALSEVKILKNF